jgi:phenylacetate-CoA ligase
MSLLQAFMLWRSFERQQWLPREHLEELQSRRLRALMRWAYATVPYYHRAFRENGIRPDDIRTARDLRRLPVLTKQDVQEHGAMLRSRNAKALRPAATTGSTGIPLTVYQDALSVAAGRAVMLRALRAHQVRLTDRMLRVTHRKHRRGLHEQLGILPVTSVSVHAPAHELARAAKKVKPNVIDAYPSVLEAMAKHRHLLPRTVHHLFSTTEMLTPHARRNVQEAFGAPVIDLYGAAEFPRLAWECPDGNGYHLDSDYAVIECTDEGMLVTGLYNCGMPLIRYAIGDLGIPGEGVCGCGRGLQVLERIEGRTDDALVMPDGSRISPRQVNVLDGLTGIRQYRIVQTRKDRIVAEVVPSGAMDDVLEAMVVTRIRQGLGRHQVDVFVKQVDAIPRGAGGKIRTVVSRVGH